MAEGRKIVRDGQDVDQAKCPECKVWADVDQEQLEGKVSLLCENCGWHGYFK